jgi:hypothetical protein
MDSLSNFAGSMAAAAPILLPAAIVIGVALWAVKRKIRRR